MTEVRVGIVDVIVARRASSGSTIEILVLQRATNTRCPLSWEAVHGRIEPGETPEQAAAREVREETGVNPEALYSLTVNPFYVLKTGTVELAVVFAAILPHDSAVQLCAEHQRSDWLSVAEAMNRFTWPRERDALRHVEILLSRGNAGVAEDVLRVNAQF